MTTKLADWKLRRDPYLAPLAEKHGEEAAFDAGFFRDEAQNDAPLDDVDWLTTPLPKRAITGPRPVVLLSTGAFCPVHDGHLAMLQSARVAAERAGFDVVGGYLSPGHDAYIRLKCGPAAIPASERLRQCAAAVASSDWLSVDPWEAMHRQVSVNFTDVTARLRAYLRAHVDPRIEVLYVAGADNARFALAFSELGGCVIVGRPGADSELATWRDRLDGQAHVIWADGDHPAASRALRASEWVDKPRRRVVVRLEDARAVRTLGLGDERYAAFRAELVVVLARYATVRTVTLVEPGTEDGVISLDAMLPSTHELAISRMFALGGYELLGHVARPGAAPLAEQVAAIARGAYALRDDDAMTGGTLASVRALLPASISITKTVLAIAHDDDEDVLDARDFLLGADHGGLVIALPRATIGRAPYVLPYVDPAVRASIPASHAFSLDVWSLNARTFAPTHLRVRDLPAPARAAIGAAGFADDVTLEAVCTWHTERLRAITPR
ncbi:MAG: putative synthase, similar to eukaryotic protein [Myxococcaceae bacterium]|nr:putative synthase, similar to eukaryotic protein [Myxococcaceae bacterium]